MYRCIFSFCFLLKQGLEIIYFLTWIECLSISLAFMKSLRRWKETIAYIKKIQFLHKSALHVLKVLPPTEKIHISIFNCFKGFKSRKMYGSPSIFALFLLFCDFRDFEKVQF